MHRHISKGGAQRIEIFTGAGRRRRWSLEEKQRIVSESYGGETTVSAVARRHALTVSQLFTWRRVLGGDGYMTATQPPSFVPVVLAGATQIGPGGGPTVTVEIGGAVVRVPHGADPSAIRAVLQALRMPA